MTYRVSLHPSVRKSLKKLYLLDRPGYDYVKQRLCLLAYRPEIGVPLEAEFQGKWRIHIASFVLVYTFDSVTNILTLLVFEHYTRAYNMYTAYA
ncbi:MAG: type II toxin-antitoxin system RelE/ParE family toxin [Alphaproteobacteria bacterium]|jgi:mRNA-degrading endonuclease RelE of RelBE toxin-antitoxin system|nr:MAG: type II toxin-antitoxin system RelE/ParE family toxin [Alphaproteobacteria bacterium]